MWSKMDEKSELCMDIITRKIDLVVMNFDRFLMPSNLEIDYYMAPTGLYRTWRTNSP